MDEFNLLSFDEFTKSYYLKQEKERLFDAILFSLKNEKLNEKDLKLICLSFYSAIFRKNKTVMNETINKIISSKDNRLIYYFVDILRLVNTDESKNILKKINSNNYKLNKYIINTLNNPYDLINDKCQSPERLDMLWGAFFGSGEKIYIKEIINAINLKINGHRGVQITGVVAEWSLRDLAKENELVYKTVKEEIENDEINKEVKEILKEIIENANKK